MSNNSSPSLSSLLASEGISILSVPSNEQTNLIQDKRKERPLLSIIKSMGGNLKSTGAAALSVVGIVSVMASIPNISHAQMMEFNNNTKDTRAVVSVKSHKPQTFSTSERSNENYSSSRMDTPSSMSGGKELEAYFLDPEAGNNLFGALATRMENLVTTIYKDPAVGRNIGIGYNIDAIGTGQAWKDLASIGMKPEQINILKNNDAAQYNKVRITPQQAANLFLLVQPRYEDIAKNWLGQNQWDKLQVNQKAAVSYLAYQTGGRIEQFQKTRTLIASGNNQEAQKHLVTYYKDSNDPTGKMQKNTRFEKHVGAMWHSPQMYAKNVGLHEIAAKWDTVGFAAPNKKTSSLTNFPTAEENQEVVSFDNRPSKPTRQQLPRAVPMTRQSQTEISDNDADNISDAELRQIKSEITALDAVIEQLQKRPPSQQFNFNHEMQRSNVPTAPPLKQIIYR